MSDPSVCSFLTKTLCAHGGRLALRDLQQRVGLSAQQLQETLLAVGPQRFLVQRDSDGAWVLAVSAVRVCVRKDCGGCERLHLCKLHLMGKCSLGSRSCKYPHNIISAENKTVLKTHELSSLDENELRVLLLQNDPFFLPDICQLYNRKDSNCSQQNNCNKLHICRHFLKGECRFLLCKRSHNLLDTDSLKVLETGGIDVKTASNMQTIYNHKHVEFNKELKKGKSPRSHVPGQRKHQSPTGTVGKDEDRCHYTGVVSDPSGQLGTTQPHAHFPLTTGGSGEEEKKKATTRKPECQEEGKAKDEKGDSSAKASEDNKEDNSDQICVFYVWKYCKDKDKCKFVHYHLPYRWQVYNGVTWNDLTMMEELEKAYCDPQTSSIAGKNIDFQTMTCCSSRLRRLSTPSSVTKPTFVLTTQWLWYWKNDKGQWIEYGEQGQGDSASSPSSAVIENLYLADPDGTIFFQAGLYKYELNFKEMTQTNISYKTRRRVCRRPKFVSSEDVQKIKKGQRDSSIPNQSCPAHWDQSALPDLGYKVMVSNFSCGVTELADNKYVSIQIVLCVVLCFKKALENILVLRYEKFHSTL
ncbi:zinc finger CCCH-type antiviral protein 1-like isoform X2 [Lathamus discolor]|uniref:zinc finger CCCH-type antiviral protein 1-like isoform X2 n=1 Tax=Lathamus discolor TaxID=678569 RepID=UPI0032B710EA